MAKPETNLINAIKRFNKKFKTRHPLFFVKTHNDGRTMRGVADLIVTLYGISIYIEAKVGKNKPTDIQLKRIKQVKAAGAISGCAYSVDEYKEYLQLALDRCVITSWPIDGLKLRCNQHDTFVVCKECRIAVNGEYGCGIHGRKDLVEVKADVG